MILEPGVMRELHWHATAAEWAFVIDGRVRTTVIDPQGYAETNDFDPGDIWYFPRGHGHVLAVPGRRADALHSHLRQRLLLRVRHVQHQRLDRPHAEAAACEELRPAGIDVRQLSERRSLLRPRPAPVGRKAAQLARPRGAATDAQVPHAGRAAALGAQGRPRMARRFHALPDLHDDDRRRARPGTGRPPRAALASHVRRMAVRDQRPSERHDVRLARPLPHRNAQCRATSATSRKASATRSKTPAARRARILIGFNTGRYEAIDLSQWIAGNPAEILATNFGQPASLSAQFPRETSLHRTAVGLRDVILSKAKNRRKPSGHPERSEGSRLPSWSRFFAPLRMTINSSLRPHATHNVQIMKL